MKQKKYIKCLVLFIVSLFLSLVTLQAQENKDDLNSLVPKMQQNEGNLVDVAFGKIDKRDMLGAISNIKVSDLMQKDYVYSFSVDSLQNFIGGCSNGNIWGQSPLILIDGVPRDESNVRSSEIESVTVLKGANAVVLYGSLAAKGVVLITTKRGKEGPMKMDLRANTGLYFPKRYPKYLNSADYMTLYNEACDNDGITEVYSSDLISNTKAGTNKYRYPDVDFFNSQYLRKSYYKSDITGEIYGGNRTAHYYTNFGFTYNNSLLKYGEANNNDNLQFNVRANVDMNITSWLKAWTDAVVNVQVGHIDRGSFWSSSATLRPNLYSPLVPISMFDSSNSSLNTIVSNSDHVIDGKYLLGGTSTYLTNCFADMLAAGYIKHNNRAFQYDVGVDADLGMLTEGLSFKTHYSVDYTNHYSEAWKVAYAVYQPTWSTSDSKDVITALTQYDTDTNSTTEYVGESQYNQTMSYTAQFNYNRTFAMKHNVAVSLLGWGFQIHHSADSGHSSSDYHNTSNVNLGLQASYNYLHKYYFDFSSAEVHSAKLPTKNRNAFSPTITLGWRISDENFFKKNVPFVDDFMLNASYGNLHQDIDISDYYLYKGYYNAKGGWYTWLDGNAGGYTVTSVRGDNPNMTYIKRQEYRLGMDASMFNGLITLDANYFLQYTIGGLTTGSSTIYPSYYSGYLAYINYNKDKRTGVDFTINLNKRIGEVDCSLGFSGMCYSSKAIRRDEVNSYAYQNSAGKPLDAYWGYICDGFFKSASDVSSSASQTFGSVQAGDLKYKDVNNDGEVDTNDKVNLGHTGWAAPPFSYGLNLTLKWNRFTLFAMGTGNAGAIGFKNSSYYWVYSTGKYSNVVKGRWTTSTASTATYPRLTTLGTTNNFMNSTFWKYSTDRFDLNKIQLTYDFSDRFLRNSIIHKLSVYLSGESLFTISKEYKFMETNIGSAPQCRFFNFGLKASF